MGQSSKYCKIISLTLLLSMMITIQHYSNMYVSKLFSCGVEEKTSDNLKSITPSVLESNTFTTPSPSLLPLKKCSQTTCQGLSAKNYIKNS